MDDVVRYTLITDFLGELVIPEPLNYRKGGGNLIKRDEKYRGFLTIQNDELELHGQETFEYIYGHVSALGLKDIRIRKEIKDPYSINERWKLCWVSQIDAGETTFDLDRFVVKTKFKETGLLNLINARESDKFDLKKTESVDGIDIGALETETVVFPGKKILFRSLNRIQNDLDQEYQSINFNINQGIEFTEYFNLVQENSYSSGDNFNTPFTQSWIDPDVLVLKDGFGVSNSIYTNRNYPKNISIDLDFDFEVIKNGQAFPFERTVQYYRIVSMVFKDNLDGTYTDQNEKVVRYDLQANIGTGQRREESISFNIELDTDELLFIGVEVNQDVNASNIPAVFDARVNKWNTRLRFDDPFVPTESKCLTLLQALNRIVELITGQKDCVKSEFLESGHLSSDLILDGFLARQFPDIVNEGTDEERRIQFQTSFKEILEHIESNYPTSLWPEFVGDKEVLRIEEKLETQKNEITVQYKERPTQSDFPLLIPSNVEIDTQKELFYSSLIFGSKKGGDDYEEVYGLQSFCGKAEYSTINNEDEQKYERLSPFRLGDVDIELARRKPFEDFPDTDTRYDSDIMCIKAKKIGDKYLPKTWQDVFEEKPTGVYDADSAFNFEYAHGFLLENHGYEINIGLDFDKGGFIRFLSSNCNSSLSTKKVGEDAFKQDDPIAHTKLKAPRVKPFVYNFTSPVSQELEDVLLMDNNFHGLIKVQLPEPEGLTYFRAIEIDTNDEGQHKLIKANING